MRAILAALTLVGCVSSPFDVSAVQRSHPNYQQEDFGISAFHAQGQDQPFMCRYVVGGGARYEPCNVVRDTVGAEFGPANYSCDTAGCHGSRLPGTALAAGTTGSLHGGEGPSCWTCHDNEWSN
ncbi:MAG: hypothetical protein EP330_08110 [Deltaproteobacteria bacterium]|nr:MAG: hypothetical protein EP330_08110 [Deltaproteobacteria bacterium]